MNTVPQELFKYRADNELTEFIFEQNKVWLSTAEELNDPFECLLDERASNQINEQYEEEVQDASTTLQFFKQFPDTFGFKETEVSHEVIGVLLRKVGIFSMSEDPVSPQMWAHYSANSTGISIGFGVVPEAKLMDSDHCVRISYSDALVVVSGDLITTGTRFTVENGRMCSQSILSLEDPTIRLAISTKTLSWQYEKEWRYIELSGGAYALPGPITSVVFGINSKEAVIRKYQQLCVKHVQNEVVFYRAVKQLNNKCLKLELL